MEENLQEIIDLIEKSALDRTIKDILIRDLKTEGLTDFLREQIEAYCVEGLKVLDEEYQKALKALEKKNQENPSA